MPSRPYVCLNPYTWVPFSKKISLSMCLLLWLRQHFLKMYLYFEKNPWKWVLPLAKILLRPCPEDSKTENFILIRHSVAEILNVKVWKISNCGKKYLFTFCIFFKSISQNYCSYSILLKCQSVSKCMYVSMWVSRPYVCMYVQLYISLCVEASHWNLAWG